MIQPRIKILEEKSLLGQRVRMSMTNNKTGELWGAFIPMIRKIDNRVTRDVISMQIYPPSYFVQFDPDAEFEKWATVEVRNFEQVPADLETFILSGGLYAVFDYKGLSNDPRIFDYIFRTWLPDSNYQLDDRPHFEVLGDKYKNNDPNSEEEIWIPIRKK